MTYLTFSLLALLPGPLFHRLARGRRELLSFLDGFQSIAIAGLILLGILPETVAQGGAWTFAFALLGLMGPSYLERSFHRAGRGAHSAALLLGLFGLCLHSILDGGALVEGLASEPAGEDVHDHGHGHLPLAIILHNVPVGLTIWMLLRPRYGIPACSGVLLLMAASTVLGYFLGERLLPGISGRGWAFFQALVSGTLLHVVVHQPADGIDAGARAKARRSIFEGFGGLAGLALLVLVFLETISEGDHPAWRTFLRLAADSAPALVLGYFLAGTLACFLPGSWVRWLSGGSAWKQSLKGMAIGLPIPVCSCGVIPLYRTLIHRGAPPAAAMAFLVATPELGVDAVLLSVPLLGWQLAAIRVVGAVIVAATVGWVVGSMAARLGPAPGGACCDGRGPGAPLPQRPSVRQAMRFGFIDGVDSTAPWILLGLAAAAAADPLLDAGWMGRWPDSLEVVVFALIGVPTYVCASGATPLVAVLLGKGMSAGAALAFLLTGPATNATTFGILARLHGRRIALAFSAGIFALAVALGLATNALVSGGISAPRDEPARESVSALSWACMGAIALLYSFSFLRRGPRRFVGEIIQTGEEPEAAQHHSHAHADDERSTPPSARLLDDES